MGSLYRKKVKIKVNSRMEQVKVVVTGETYSWKSVPQGSGLREESCLVEHGGDVCYYVGGMAVLVVEIRPGETKGM